MAGRSVRNGRPFWISQKGSDRIGLVVDRGTRGYLFLPDCELIADPRQENG